MKNFLKKFSVSFAVLTITIVFLIMMSFVFESAMTTARSWGWDWNNWNINVQIHRNINNALVAIIWITVITFLIIPLNKFKKIDHLYKFVKQLPIEAYAIGLFFLLVWIANNLVQPISSFIQNARALFHVRLTHIQNFSVLAFLGLVFLAICILAYSMLYLKDIYINKTWQQHSLIWRLIGGQLTSDFKKSQRIKIAALVFGLPVGGFFVFWLSYVATWLPGFSLFLLVMYILCIFLVACKECAVIQKNYLRLFAITQGLAQGDLTADDTEDLGYFNDLRNELLTVQHGFSHAVEQALSSERMKGELITNVSHDLKTPLTSIITYIDLLQKADITDEKRDEYLKTLDLKTDRLKMLIEDLFEVSRASSGNIDLELTEVDVKTLMKQTILGLEDRIATSGILLRKNYPETLVKLQLDGARMHRVLENLIVNMINYAMVGTRAYIDVLDEDDCVKFIFRNISAQEITHDVVELAQRFVRGEESRTTDGSGLGLAIAKSFVELQGGCFEITIDGDLFKVVLNFSKSD